MNSPDVQNSLVGQIEYFEPLIVTNDRHTFIRQSIGLTPSQFLPERYLQKCPLAVLDGETVQLIQVQQLHQAIDHTQSATGSAALLRSLLQPSTNLPYIIAKQESLQELAANDNLRRSLLDCVCEFSQGETALYTFFNKGIYALFPYPGINQAREAARRISRIIQALPVVESTYLRALLSSLQAYPGSAIDQMMHGAIYKTLAGLQSAGEVSAFTPKVKFTPRRFTPWLLTGPLVALAPHIQDKIGLAQLLPPVVAHIGYAWTGIHLLYRLFFKPARDTFNFIEPFREKCIADGIFNRAIDAFGMLDELLSFDTFARELPHAAILPRVTDESHHAFGATGLRNPVLAVKKEAFVPNDVHLNGARLTFISGPNSGGKTTICKSIAQNQLLAQAGGYVVAEQATINIADKIRYQAPKFDGLQDDEGRFGTELARTRDIFFESSPKSLVILDELAEGTTYEERMEESSGIMRDFHTIGNNTMLVTHNHSLVDRFMDEEKGQCLKTEFNGNEPTYRIVSGISRVSHASRIAEKINFSSEDRRRYLIEKGYA
jgi:DNA mismatch repair protein MutS